MLAQNYKLSQHGAAYSELSENDKNTELKKSSKILG